MPLVGTICCRTGEPSRFDSCVNCAKYGVPEPCQHPFPLITAMRDNKSSRQAAEGTLSATTLLDCTRFHLLSQDYEYYESPESFEARFKGTLVHAGLEKMVDEEDDVINEVRFFKELKSDLPNGYTWIISGTPDVVLPEFQVYINYETRTGRIIDGKSAGRRSLHPDMVADDNHIRQVNIYRWLLKGGWYEEPIYDSATGMVASRREVDIDINSAVIWYIGDKGLQEVEVPCWPIDVVEGMIKQLVAPLEDYQLPPILPSKYVTRRKTGITEEVRNWKCDRCPLRGVCDTFPKEGIKRGGLEADEV